MSEVKRIPTMSWLVRRAEALLRKNPDEYAKLRDDGTEQLLKGCRVTMQGPDLNGNCLTFFLYYTTKYNKCLYATITGVKLKEEFYTRYDLQFSATQHRKRMHKWLPISLPGGVKQGVEVKADYYNADGTFANSGTFYQGRRGVSGTPSVGALIIRDRDGKFVGEYDEAIRIAQGFSSSSPSDLWHCFIPGTVPSKMDWYRSMTPPDFKDHDMMQPNGKADIVILETGKPLWDERKVKTLAARVHSEALKITKQFPYIKVAMFPGGPFGNERDSGHKLGRHSRFGQRNGIVASRDSQGEPLMWMPPELILYWVIPPKETYHGHAYEGRYVRVVIPPVGCDQLRRRGDESYLTTTYRWGKREEHYLKQKLKTGSAIERAYHQLVCYRAGTIPDGTLRHKMRYRSLGMKIGSDDINLHDWDADPNVVIVHDGSKCPYRNNLEPVAAKPEGIFRSIEEKELVDSLPLC